MRFFHLRHLLVSVCCLTLHHPGQAATTFRVASFNVENYLAQSAGSRPIKSAEARAAVRASIHELKPDVLAMQEMGGTDSLLELRSALKVEGLDFPHWEIITGNDTNIHIAVLSKFPFAARHPHTNEAFLLNGRRFRVSRGFVELDIQVTATYQFTLLAAHLKSKRPVPEADQAELREQEALLLRRHIEARLTANPTLNLLVLGDFNDTRDTKPIRSIVGRGKYALLDTRPAEPGGDSTASTHPHYAPHTITWTYHFGKEDTYSRIDYILISPGLAREWDPAATLVLNRPSWGKASDHRPILATFRAEDH